MSLDQAVARKNDAHEAARRAVEEALDRDYQAYARTKELGSALSLSDAVQLVIEAVQEFKDLRTGRLEILQPKLIQSIIQATKDVAKVVESMTAISPASHDVVNQREHVMRAASLLPENVQAKIAQALALVRADRALQLAQRPVRVVEQDIAMLRDELKAVKLEREEARATAEHFRRELNSIVDGARAFSATSVVGANAKVYDDSGARHSDASFWWLIAVILVSALLAGLTIYGVVLAFDAPLGTTEQIIQVGLAKLMVFSVLSFAVLFCSRVYRAHKHNQTLYEHRANALRSFLAFVNATEDKRTRDIILGHAANAAFASRASGFDVTSQESLTASIPGLDALTGAASPNS